MIFRIAGIVLMLCTGLGFTADDAGIKSVFIKDSEVYVAGPGDAAVARLTSDGLPKAHPVWSRDGKKIAFIRASARRSLGDLVVLSPSGEKLLESSFRPEESGTSVMRFVEEVQWQSEQHLLISGSVNPSSCEYVVVDAASGREIDWYATDGWSLAVSPDGAHVAYEAMLPHGMAQSDRRPRICFDHECELGNEGKAGYPLDRERRVEFATAPVWSASGKAVAVLAQDQRSHKLLLMIRPLQGATAEVDLLQPSPDYRMSARGSAYRVWWSGESVFATVGQQTWRIDSRSGAVATGQPGEESSDLADALSVRVAERQRLHALGATEVNSWCESCGLRLLPRRQNSYEEVQDIRNTRRPQNR